MSEEPRHLRAAEDAEQDRLPLDFGAAINATQFSLRMGIPQPETEKRIDEMEYGKRIYGTFSGVVAGETRLPRKKDGSMVLTRIVELDDVKITKVEDE